MNIVKKIVIVATVLFATIVANAEEGLKIGGTVQYIAIQPGVGGFGGDDPDMSFIGAGVGVAAQVPLGSISVNPEVSFLYRRLFSQTTEVGSMKTESYESEFAISVPVTVRYSISNAYVGTGIQLDFPIAAKINSEISGSPRGIADGDTSTDFEKRKSHDLGIAIVAGYNVSEAVAINAKAIIGFTRIAAGDEMTFNQYSIGVTYFFF